MIQLKQTFESITTCSMVYTWGPLVCLLCTFYKYTCVNVMYMHSFVQQIFLDGLDFRYNYS